MTPPTTPVIFLSGEPVEVLYLHRHDRNSPRHSHIVRPPAGVSFGASAQDCGHDNPGAVAPFDPMRAMTSAGGYVRLYRSMREWEWFHDLPVRVLFQYLLIEVNYLPGRFEGRDIAPGQLPTSTNKLAQGSGLTRQSVRTALDKLKSTGEITTEATHDFSIITIVNWEKYQSDKRTSTRGSTHQATSEQHASNTPATTIEEGKKGKREENTSRASLEDRVAAFRAECRAVIEADPGRLPQVERKAFLNYWTEANKVGKMRFEGQDYFDFGRRMDTWRSKAERDVKHGDGTPAEPPPIKRVVGWQTMDPTRKGLE